MARDPNLLAQAILKCLFCPPDNGEVVIHHNTEAEPEANTEGGEETQETEADNRDIQCTELFR